MLTLDSLTPLERLQNIALYLDADFNKAFGAATLKLHNSYGKGYINTYEFFTGLSISVFNIRFTEEFRFQISEKAIDSIYLLYCTEGHFYQSFGSKYQPVRIMRAQNVLLSNSEYKIQLFTIPAQMDFKLVFTEILKVNPKSRQGSKRTVFSDVLSDVFATIGKIPSHRYISQTDKKVEIYAEPLIESRTEDVVGKILSKALALNILACQLENYQDFFSGAVEKPPLTTNEIDKLLSMTDAIGEDLSKPYTIKSISDALAISPSKLQAGFTYLFGESVANYVKNLRLEKAKEIIQTTDYTMSEVAEMIGISSKSHFSKIFKSRFGLLPNQYKISVHSEQKLFELTYRSKAAFYLGKAEINTMVGNADNNNRSMEVTGCLIYHENQFYQFLEGPMAEVLFTFAKIEKDNRHSDIQVIWKGIREERLFAQWGLILISEKREIRELITNKDIGLDIRAMFTDDAISSVANLRFWKRIRDRLRAQSMA